MQVLILQGTEFSQKDLIKSLPSHLKSILNMNFNMRWDGHNKWWTMSIGLRAYALIREVHSKPEVVIKHLVEQYGITVSDVIEVGSLSYDSFNQNK